MSLNPFRWLNQLFCGEAGGHSWDLSPGLWDESFCHFCKKVNRGHRKSDSGDRGQAGASLGSAVSFAIAHLPGAPAREGASARVVVDQEILAERAWHLSQDAHGAVLQSLTRPDRWDGPSFTADAIPSPDLPHGLYALRTIQAHELIGAVYGTVALSGVVVEGENGYRAERMTIRSLRLRSLPDFAPTYASGSGFLYVPTGGFPLTWRSAWLVAEQLAQRYQCDVSIDWQSTSCLPASYLEA